MLIHSLNQEENTMKSLRIMKRTISTCALGISKGISMGIMMGITLALSGLHSAYAADIDAIHFLIPGGAGGGWDGTARGTGEALTKAGIVGSATFENMSGGGGGKAIGYLIENAASNHGTLMVNSTPIVIRSLTGRFPQSFRDLTIGGGHDRRLCGLCGR